MKSARQIVALVLCLALPATGCASAGAPRVSTGVAGTRQVQDPAVLVEYVQKLSPGTTVRVERVSGRSVRGTLMKATADAVVIQQRTRKPEPALEIPMGDILSMTPDAGSGAGFSLAKAIGAAVAAGAGAALAVFLVLAAIYH